MDEIYILNCDDSVEWLGQPRLRSLSFTYLQYVPLFVQTIYKLLNLSNRIIQVFNTVYFETTRWYSDIWNSLYCNLIYPYCSAWNFSEIKHP